MKHLKLFQTEADYNAFIQSEDFITPNVSYAEDGTKVYYNPHTEAKETRLVCTYNVTDTTSATPVCYETSGFTSMEVDGVLLDGVTTEYTFNTVGEHTIKFELANPTFIGNNAFYRCTGLTSVVIPDSVTTIGDYAFYCCTGLTSVVIPDSVTTIGDYAFQACTSLPVVDNIYYAETYLVGVVDKSLSTYTIKEGTKWIGTGAFSSCTGLTSLTSIVIPNSVTTISGYAFTNCTGLTSVVIPEGITTIGVYAFSDCSSLTSVVIPNSVTTISGYAFYNCPKLKSITCNAITAPSIKFNTFRNIKQYGILKVPTGSDYSTWMSTSNYYLGKYNWAVEYI